MRTESAIMREELKNVSLSDLQHHPRQPRVVNTDAEKFQELVASIRKSGVQEPLILRDLADGSYQILSGHRRAAAAIEAGLKQVPAIVRYGISDQEAYDTLILSFLGREDLTLWEEAAAIEDWLRAYDGDVKAVASLRGWTERQVRLRMRLQKLSDAWRAATSDASNIASKLTAAHLELVARLPYEVQDTILQDVRLEVWKTAGKKYQKGLISVAELDREIAAYTRTLASARWDLADAALVAKAGACCTCLKRTSCNPGLFDDQVAPVADGSEVVEKGDKCLDPECWAAKEKALLKRKEKELREKHEGLVLVQTEYGRGSKGTEPAKKTDKGAVPAMKVDGKAAGSVTYVKVKEEPRRSGSRASKPAAKAPEKKDVGVMRAELAARRQSMVVAEVLDRIWSYSKQATRVPLPDEQILWRMLITFGCSQPRIPGLKLVFACSQRYQAARKLTAQQNLDLAWNGICESIRDIEPNDDTLIDLAETLGIDVPAIRLQVESDLPEPKEWLGLKDSDVPGKQAEAEPATGKAKKTRKARKSKAKSQ